MKNNNNKTQKRRNIVWFDPSIVAKQDYNIVFGIWFKIGSIIVGISLHKHLMS